MMPEILVLQKLKKLYNSTKSSCKATESRPKTDFTYTKLMKILRHISFLISNCINCNIFLN